MGAAPRRAAACAGRAGGGGLNPALLPAGIRSRFVDDVNGLRMHVLEAGFESQGPARRRCCLHGFPELAYSWRKVMLPIAVGGLSRDRARPAGLRAHHGHGRRPTTTTSRRSARSTWSGDVVGPGLRVRLPLGRRRRSATTSGLAARGLVRGRAPGRVPLGGDDERAVRRPACAAVRHRRCGRRPRATGRRWRHDLRRAGGADAAAQALPAVLHDARGERQHAELRRRASTRSCAPTTT